MTVEQEVKARIEELIDEAQALRTTHGNVRDNRHMEECRGWLAATLFVIALACPASQNAYRREAERIASSKWAEGAMIPTVVGSISELLKRLMADVDKGLLTSVSNRAKAEVFDDFLDHAEVYLNAKCKDEAGVIAGVVFEDTVRRICRNNGIDENGVKLDTLITELRKADLLTELKAKRARTAANLRTSASHARWDEFAADDVGPVIQFTRELVGTHLD